MTSLSLSSSSLLTVLAASLAELVLGDSVIGAGATGGANLSLTGRPVDGGSGGYGKTSEVKRPLGMRSSALTSASSSESLSRLMTSTGFGQDDEEAEVGLGRDRMGWDRGWRFPLKDVEYRSLSTGVDEVYGAVIAG